MIPLVKNTINEEDIANLIKWLQTNPRLTKGDRTIEFEMKWSEWCGSKYSVFINSGSSANLAMIYAMLLMNGTKNKKIVVPAVSWTTTATPAIHFGMTPILCDCNLSNLGVDVIHLEDIFKRESPLALIIVHVLGFPCDIEAVKTLCDKYDVILLEDTCESAGSCVKNKKLGTYGLGSSFSFYYGHHMSTIEGGMICTDNFEFYEIIKSIRSHGWDRDLSPETQAKLRKQYNIDDFRALYTFYYPGFNLRSTDLQAVLGLDQLKKMDSFSVNRNKNLMIYDNNINNNYWKIKIKDDEFISNFAYPIIHPNVNKLADNLRKNNIECRPLICGSIGEQPYWIELYGKETLKNATIVHNHGIYVPNNHELTDDEVLQICNVVNTNI